MRDNLKRLISQFNCRMKKNLESLLARLKIDREKIWCKLIFENRKVLKQRGLNYLAKEEGTITFGLLGVIIFLLFLMILQSIFTNGSENMIDGEHLTKSISGFLMIEFMLVTMFAYFIRIRWRSKKNMVSVIDGNIYPIFVIFVLYVFMSCLQVAFVYDNTQYWNKVHKLGKNITDVLKFVIPVTITIYTFSYRERKQIASSMISSIAEKIQLNFFIFFSIVSFSAGIVLYNWVDEKEAMTYNILLIGWYISVIITGVLLYLVLRKSFHNIDIAKIFPEVIGQVNKEILVFKEMMNLWDGEKGTEVHKALKEQKQRIHAHMESAYQMLEYMNEKNMNLLFDDMHNATKNPLSIFNNVNFFDLEKGKILEHDRARVYMELYQSILRNHIKLIVKLFNANKIVKGKETLETLTKELNPELNTLFQCYNQQLYELTSNFNLGDSHKFNILIEALNKIEKGRIYKVYQNLILRAVESNDVKFLCDIVYSVTREEDNLKHYSGILMSNVYIDLLRGRIVQKDIHLTLRAILKSIQLGHHSCAGFLVKFLITRFKREDVNIVLEVFSQDSANLVLDFSENEQYTDDETDDQKIDFNFNLPTFNYCFYKMTILIYAQQKFSRKNKLPRTDILQHNLLLDVRKLLVDCDYTEYLLNKIINVKDKYGLLFLTNDDFIEHLKNDVIN
ncbi:hypothetical protein CN277_11080 [Bacillus cereus]|uniref:hypothetical protein n=2 Tax=Bacillus cereus TaxID=1396 RepID=UPI000BEC03D2|nr:hypothetical protein [Bacillus cereus]PEE56861.1 hypothetical protein COM68_22275 [Bacillus cereus]PFC62504.1 hypothetical protein CN267_08550 [Bacillus cereus]PFD02788.1 hypothetical protein CN277_11080 [Bacillus cereus]